MNTQVSNPIFYMHLISTIMTMFFIVVIWWVNRKIIKINYDLMKDNREILVLSDKALKASTDQSKKIQDRMNDIEAKMPGTIWVDLEANKAYTRVLKDDK